MHLVECLQEAAAAAGECCAAFEAFKAVETRTHKRTEPTESVHRRRRRKKKVEESSEQGVRALL